MLFVSCRHEKKSIEFKKLANLDLGNISRSTATVTGVAVFTNLTDQEYTLKTLVLDFTIDGKDIGTIVMKPKKTIQPNSEFSVPIEYTYNTRSFIQEEEDPASTYAVELLGDLIVKNTKDEELSTTLKFATTYEYLTRREKRMEKREGKKEKDATVDTREQKMADKKEERRKRREERKAKRNN
jgi:hypothetical protein